MNTMRTLSRLRASVSAAVAVLFVMSCSDQPTDPTEDLASSSGMPSGMQGGSSTARIPTAASRGSQISSNWAS